MPFFKLFKFILIFTILLYNTCSLVPEHSNKNFLCVILINLMNKIFFSKIEIFPENKYSSLFGQFIVVLIYRHGKSSHFF